MPSTAPWRVAFLVPWTVSCIVCPQALADPTGQTLDVAAFEQLKSLAGRWQGQLEGPASAPATVDFEVTSNGKAVLERQFPGTSHEMVTVYYLAYDRLQATHYCAMGNQPAFALAARSTPQDIIMEFSGGTGFDPAKDPHVNGEHIEIVAPDRLRVAYEFRTGSEAPTSEALLLARARPVSAEPAKP